MEELATIVARAQKGDVDAFTTIVRRFQDMAVTCALSHLAQDAAQDAFLGAYLKSPRAA